MKSKYKFIRKGRVIYRVYPSRIVPIETCESELDAALLLPEFIRLQGGELGPIPLRPYRGEIEEDVYD
jgi:hypothetical protein